MEWHRPRLANWVCTPTIFLTFIMVPSVMAEDAAPTKAFGGEAVLSTATPIKALPPLDCWRCPGPPACAPCFGDHAGFLYYGTHPWDDDCVNGFDDCPSGDCGHVGRAISVHWIRHHTGRRFWFWQRSN